MNEQDNDSLNSLRESSSFELRIKTAESKAEVQEILHEHDLPDEDFTNRFPVLAKLVQELPDETAPRPDSARRGTEVSVSQQATPSP